VKKIIIVSAIVIVALGLSFLYFGARADGGDPTFVEFVDIEKTPFIYSISVTGKTISRKMELVKAPVQGIILDSGYKNKDNLKKGTIIARVKLEDQEFLKKQQQYELARIDLDLAREQRELAEELLAAKAIPERDVKQLKIQEYKQQINMGNLEAELAPKELVANFSGMIVNKKFNNQDRIASGTELYTLIDVTALCVELPVFQQDVPKLKVGQQVILTSDTFDSTRNGEITEISTVATQPEDNRSRRNVAATFNVYTTINELPEDKTLFGSNIDAEIVLAEMDSVISIPLEAILYSEDEKIVFVFENGKARERPVETGKCNDTTIEIVSGLTEGEKVITRGNLDLKDGTAVTIERQSTRRRNPFVLPYFR